MRMFIDDIIELILEIIFEFIFDKDTYNNTRSPFLRGILSVLYTITFLGLTIFLFVCSKSLLNDSLIAGILVLTLATILSVVFIIKAIKWFYKLSR